MTTPHQTPHKTVSPDISPNITPINASASATQAVHRVPDASTRTASVSERTPEPTPRPAEPDSISTRQRWAHNLVLDMLKANLPLPALADHLKIPFRTLIDYINTPEVQAEIDAYEALINLRARLIGQTARPVSLRKLLDVLESPAPRPTGRDIDADQRTLHRHAELIRRTATTIARESRALAPAPSRAPKSSTRTANVSERTSSESSGDRATGCSSASAPGSASQTAGTGERTDAAPSPTPGRTEPPARQSPTDALRAAAGSTHTVPDPSRRSRDRPAA